MAERLRRLTRNQFPSGSVGFKTYRLRSRLRNCISILSDDDVGSTGKHRFQNKVFIINTVYQCYTDPPSMWMVSSVKYLSLSVFNTVGSS